MGDHDNDAMTPDTFDGSMLAMLSGYKVQVSTSNSSYYVTAIEDRDQGIFNRAPIPRTLALSDRTVPGAAPSRW